MKKLNECYYSFIFISIITLVSGCKEDVYAPIQNFPIQFEIIDEASLLAYPKDTLYFSLRLSSGNDIKSVSTSLDGIMLSNSEKTYPDNIKETGYSFSYVVKENEVGTTLNFTVQAYDKDEKLSTKELLVYVQSPKANIEIVLPNNLPDSVIYNNKMQFDISINSVSSLKSIKTYLNNVILTELTKETFDSSHSDVYQFNYTPSVNDIGHELVFTFETMDSFGKTKSVNYVVKVIRGDIILDINEFYNINLGAQNCTSAGSFINSATGEVHFYTGVSAYCESIDLVNFYSNNSYAFNITSPSKQSVADFIYKTGDDAMNNWSVRNTTIIKMSTTTASDFASIDNYSQIQTLFDNSGAESDTSTKLNDGSTLVFKTAKDKYGIVLVKSRSANSTSGYLVLDMKVQK